ncbi:MAG: GntR family transcriptional regulator [Nocardioidaceae bacterium]
MNAVSPDLGHLTTRVRNELAARISSGDLAPGEQLPTERELSATFGVSRVTVRRALASLADEGLVHAIQGRGTFVPSDTLTEPPNALLSFHDMVGNTSVKVGAEPLRVEVRPATIAEAELFGIAPGASMFELERLRTLDDLPVALDTNILPLALDPALPEADWSSESLYSRLAAAGRTPMTADYAVEARPADEVEAKLLSAEVGSPLLVAESHTLDADGRLVVSGVISYRGDRYRFRSTLSAHPHAVRHNGARRA